MSTDRKPQLREDKSISASSRHSLKPPSNISAFLSKLWRMVNDTEVDDLIGWNDSGTCFVIQNQYEFWANLLPLYYKHNNMASFVRQLNMYGFHKVTSDASLPDNELQFYHEFFQRDSPELLEKIKRKVAVPRAPVLASPPAVPTNTVGVAAPTIKTPATSPIKIDTEDLSRVLTDVKDIQGRQSSFNNQLAQLKHENSVLWSELAMLRQRHTKQQAIVNKLIHFLVTLVQTPNQSNRMGVKRTFPLMIDHDIAAVKKPKTGGRGRSRDAGLRIHELSPDISEAIDEDSVNTLETVTAQHSAPPTPTNQVTSEFSPEEFLHSPEPKNEDAEEVIIGGSTDFVDEFFHKDDKDEVITLPSEIKSPSGSEIPSTFNSEFEGIGEENSDDGDDLFLNPSASNTLITSLMNGSYNRNTISDTLRSKLAATIAATSPSTSTSFTIATNPSMADVSLSSTSPSTSADNLTVATMSKPPKPQRLKSVVGDELGQHVKETQSELDSIKDIIYGSNGVDLNYLLGLFEESPSFNLVPQQNSGNLDPSISNTISTYEQIGSPMPLDFSELMEAMNNESDPLLPISADDENAVVADSSSINTPLIFEGTPSFPSYQKK